MIAGNSASFGGGGIDNGGTLTLTNSTVSGNSAIFGGGIYANGGTGEVTLSNSTISGNSGFHGGGIFVTLRSLVLRNSTIARNSATQEGGGILVESGGGDGALVLRNSLVALNSAPSGSDVLKTDGTIRARFSLIRIGNGSGLTNGVNGNQVGSASTPLDPKLGQLADNGGPTRTHALLAGSPAIDAASTPDCPTTDQRRVLRPQGPACDIGSYERK